MTDKIKSFSINNLFESINVNLKFDEIENIYIGENGIGKTTILSTIFYTIKGKFFELSKIEFDSIRVEFIDGDEYSFTKDDIEQYLEINRSSRRRFPLRFYKLLEEILNEKITELLLLKEELSPQDFRRHDLFINMQEEISSKLQIGSIPAGREILEYLNRLEFNSNAINKLVKKIEQFKKENEILYFPTFRRIEEDLNKLIAFSHEEENDYVYRERDREIKNLNQYGELIKFGMVDVDTTIKEMLEKIRETSINSFNQMTGVLLKQYVSKEVVSNTTDKIEEIDLQSLIISLNRVGSAIDQIYKDKIIELVESKEIYSKENSYLLNFINNLLSSQQHLRTIDNKIEKFAGVCNSYLVNKQYHYDASNVTLQIINTASGKVIPLTKLSSGEKQIISTFSKIYLEYEKDYIILFDEPELSLSIEWQEQFIPDIINSGNCKQLICVTHSPFIFKQDRLFGLSKEILDEIEFVSELAEEVE